MRPLPALLAAVAVALAGCLRAPPNPFSRDLSIENEIELGAQIHSQIRAQAPLVTDPILLAYLNELGQELVAVTEPQPFVYRFNLIIDDELNAFAVPGGYIYLHTGTLAQAGNVSELAGVLAHEVAHVRRRHIARAQEKSGATSLASLAALIAAAAAGDPDVSAAIIAASTGINVGIQLKHSRDHEAEADRYGISYMLETGYPPMGMVRFFQRILAEQRGDPSVIPPYLYSHPEVRKRIEDAKVEIERLGGAPPSREFPEARDDAPAGPEPPSLAVRDARLSRMQARLAALLSPVAGGSGLLARPSFDREVSEPLLEEARRAVERGEPEAAEAVLARAERLEPNDPRVPLERADLAKRRGDPEGAVRALERAFELDPKVPLVQYELGLAHKRLGNRTQAVFYLEQAATGYREGSPGRRRAEFEISTLAFPVLESSGVSDDVSGAERERFTRGEAVVWWGRVSPRFAAQEPSFHVRWLDPDGRVVREQRPEMRSGRWLSAELDTGDAAPGSWTVEVLAGDSRVEQRSFVIDATPAPAGRGA